MKEVKYWYIWAVWEENKHKTEIYILSKIKLNIHLFVAVEELN